MLLHGGLGYGYQGRVPELLYGPQLHEVAGVLGLDGAGDADVDHHIVPGLLQVLGLGVQQLLELQGVVVDELLLLLVPVQVHLGPVLAEGLRVVQEGAGLVQLQGGEQVLVGRLLYYYLVGVPALGVAHVTQRHQAVEVLVLALCDL